MTGSTGYNVEALEQLREDITREAKGGHHNQASWGRIGQAARALKARMRWDGEEMTLSCPTTACAAGWTVTRAGALMLFAQHYDEANYCLLPDGSVKSISDHAQELLGLDVVEASELFSGSTDTKAVLAYLDEIIMAAHHKVTWREMRRILRNSGVLNQESETMSESEDMEEWEEA